MFEKLRKIKPEIKNINEPGGRLDPRFYSVKLQVPAKEVANTRSNMDLLHLYTHELKWENTGNTCFNCVNYYPDPNLKPKHGRCKAKGFIQVHEDLAADDRQNYWEPDGRVFFPQWPACPLYTEKSRLSRK